MGIMEGNDKMVGKEKEKGKQSKAKESKRITAGGSTAVTCVTTCSHTHNHGVMFLDGCSRCENHFGSAAKQLERRTLRVCQTPSRKKIKTHTFTHLATMPAHFSTVH